LGAALALAAGVWLLRELGLSDALVQASTDAAAIERAHFDGFFACAFPNGRPPDLDAQQVSLAFERLGNGRGKAYANKTLRECQPRMQALNASVLALRVPESAQPSHAELVSAAGALMAANTQYLLYLSTPEPDYEPDLALPMIEAFGDASARYLAAQQSLQTVLERRL
jgi:hypothetical protein